MTRIYVDSNASGAADGTSWADAYLTLQAGISAWAWQDHIWVAHDHAETSAASVTFTNGTGSSPWTPVALYRVNSSTNEYAPSPLDQSDTIQLDTTTAFDDIKFDIHAVWMGFRFRAANDITVLNDRVQPFIDCTVEIGRVTSASGLIFTYAQSVQFINSSLRCVTTTDATIESSDCTFVSFKGCIFPFNNSALGLVIPDSDSRDMFVAFDDCDLSQIANNILVDSSTFVNLSDDEVFNVVFKHCKLKSTYELNDGTLDIPTGRITAEACSTSSVSYVNHKVRNNGTVNSSIVSYLNSGFRDSETDVAASQEVTPNSKCKHIMPLGSFHFGGLFDVSGTRTFTVELLENYTTALTAQDCWLELYYFDSATSSHHAVDISTREIAKLTYTTLSAGGGLAAWISPPAGSRSAKLSVTATVAKAGLYHGRVYVGKYEAGKVVHINPQFSGF